MDGSGIMRKSCGESGIMEKVWGKSGAMRGWHRGRGTVASTLRLQLPGFLARYQTGGWTISTSLWQTWLIWPWYNFSFFYLWITRWPAKCQNNVSWRSCGHVNCTPWSSASTCCKNNRGKAQGRVQILLPDIEALKVLEDALHGLLHLHCISRHSC